MFLIIKSAEAHVQQGARGLARYKRMGRSSDAPNHSFSISGTVNAENFNVFSRTQNAIQGRHVEVPRTPLPKKPKLTHDEERNDPPGKHGDWEAQAAPTSPSPIQEISQEQVLGDMLTEEVQDSDESEWLEPWILNNKKKTDAKKEISDIDIPSDSLLASKIIYRQEFCIKQHMTGRDLDEIDHVVPNIPPLHDALDNVFDQFKHIKNRIELMSCLAALLNREAPFQDEPQDDETRIWMVSAIGSWALKTTGLMQRYDQSERWWPMNVYSRVFDDLIQVMPQVIVQR